MRNLKGPVEFKVYLGPQPTRKGPYVWARVFPDRAAMYAYVKSCNREHARSPWRRRQTTYNFEGLSRHWSRFRVAAKKKKAATATWKRMPNVGEVLLHFGYLGGGIVAHEFVHQALHFAKLERRRIAHAAASEERFCYSVGFMVSQFWDQLYRRVPKLRPRMAASIG